MIETVIGRNATPVSIGEKPSTCCRYSETKYHMANTLQPRKNTTMFAAVSVREREDPQRHERPRREARPRCSTNSAEQRAGRRHRRRASPPSPSR